MTIIVLIISIGAQMILANYKYYKLRNYIESNNRLIYCIMQELKYNYTVEEVIDQMNNLNFKNYDEFIIDLLDKDLMLFERGNDIKIYIDEIIDGEKLGIKIELYNDKEVVVQEREFIKYKWMDYYEKL